MKEGKPAERALATRDELTREERKRLRRGELDADTIAALMHRTEGLAAPPAPLVGELVPNGSGWRVGEGGLTQRLHPRLLRLAVWAGYVAALGPNWPMLVGLPYSFALGLMASLTPMATLLGGVRLAAELKLRRLLRAPRIQRLDEEAHGKAVTVAGVIASGATVPTLFRGAPAVLFKSVASFVEQTQGIDFELDVEGGQRARVSVRRAMLLDRAQRTYEPPACGPVSSDGRRLTSALFTGPSWWTRLFGPGRLREVSVGPGDRIEVCGVLHHEPDPDARAPFARQMPIRTVLRAPPGLPLLVRRLD